MTNTPTPSDNTTPARIIPCLDINGGRVVKGVNFTALTDAGDPVEIAQRYDEQGADELTLLDISATAQGRTHILDIVTRIAKSTALPLIIGGGVQSTTDIQRLLDAGASKVSIGSAAIAHPELIDTAAQQFGSHRIIVAIDARQAGSAATAPHWEVLTQGGRKDTGIDAIEWATQMAQRGAGELLLTSMDRDGTKQGFDLALTQAVSRAVSIPIIASGGVGTLQHLADGILKGGANAVLAASIFHFGEFTIAQARAFLQQQGIVTTPLRTPSSS